jgi:hypothetical protein
MSATTRPATDAPQVQGEDFNAVFAEMTAARDIEPAAGQGEPARQEQAQTPEDEDEGRQTPPRDERGRFTSQRQETQAPPAQEPGQPAQPATQEQPAPDKAAQLEARLAELERSYGGNLRQKDQQIEALRQQFAQGEQTWRQRETERVEAQRKAAREDLERRIAQARAQNPDLTEQEIVPHRRALEAQFLEEDLARERADRQAEREGWQQFLGASQRQQVLTQLPAALGEYAPHMAGLARAQHGAAVSDDEARAFLAEPQIQRAIRETLPLGREAVNTLSGQFAYVLAQRAHLAAQQREAAAQRQLADNRAAAAGNGATRELVPGSAGPTDPDLARFQSRPGNEGDHFDALWAATRQEQ